ncbi:MAG: tetratricopeptide repeat protein [Gammaproteobacteria bacterium]
MQKTFFLIVVLLSTPVLAIDAETGAQHAAKGDFATAYNIWKVFAEEGDAMSQFYLGVLYEKGSGVEKDYPQALFWYIKSAEQGVAKASYNIGNMFFNGRGVSKDYKEAERRFRHAADLNYPPAQFNLAYILDRGLNGKKNPTEAFNWYLKSAENGVQKAQSKVGKLYETGSGVAKNKEKAIYWYKKVAHNNPEIRIRLAKLYLKDQKTLEEGIRLLRSGAENGDKLAQYELGYLYGQGEKVKQDFEQATFWYQRAAKQQVPEAQYLLCLSYSLGKGVPVDFAVAQVWCEAAVLNKAEGAEAALGEIKEAMRRAE